MVKEGWVNMVKQLSLLQDFSEPLLCSEYPTQGCGMQQLFCPGVLPTNSTQVPWGRNRSLALPSCPFIPENGLDSDHVGPCRPLDGGVSL